VKAWWKVSDKPRGRWNPQFAFGINLSEDEKREAQALNVSLKIEYCLFLCQDPDPAACGKCRKGYHILVWPTSAYAAHTISPDRDALYASYSCDGCFFKRGRMDQGAIYCDSGESWHYRLPWRPGRRPDYSDFIEPTRAFLLRALEDLQRRFAEARESSPSDEWMLEEEFDSFSVATWQTESGVAVAERKLRVIRA